MKLLVPTAEDMRLLGVRLADLVRAGDLLLLTGDLGAGKTTLTQGIAEGLTVRGPITSPTFVLSREHPSLVGGPSLVHADAYRLTDETRSDAGDAQSQFDALDLDASLQDSVTVVEWGGELVAGLGADYLEVTLSGDTARRATLLPHGARWSSPQAAEQLDPLVGP